jgi:ribonuclease T1
MKSSCASCTSGCASSSEERGVRSKPCRRLAKALLAGLLLAAAAAGAAREAPRISEIRVAELPREARETLQLIKHGGPFPYARDGSIFGNRERLLPLRERGYYREYTVKTPGARDRGARRIVAGGCAPAAAPRRGNNDAGNAGARRNAPAQHFVAPCAGGEYYYTIDHYASFRRIRE